MSSRCTTIFTLQTIYKTLFIEISELMSKKHRRIHTTNNDHSFLTTIHQGFNYFYEMDMPSSRSKIKTHQRVTHSISNLETKQRSISQLLQHKKQTYSKIKTEFAILRENQLNQYIKKSMKYQEILNINDNKKKRLPTLNAKIGEVVKKSVLQNTNKNIEYYLTTTHYKLQEWRPESREGHTTTCYKNLAIIIGGHCSSPFSVAQIYSFDCHNWIKQMQVSSARSYHSAILYKSRFIIVFGGMGTYDVSRKCRVCFNSINLIDLQTWTARVLKMSNQEAIEGRRSHGAALMGKYMIVFGGVNTRRQYLRDFVYLDLKELRWYHKEYKVEGRELNEDIDSGIAKHRMVSHFKSTHKNYPLYSSQYSDDEGIYIFGGTFGNGSDNIISFICFNKYNPCLKKIDYRGVPPPSTEPLVEKVNQNLVAIISGESNERSLKLFLIKEREFVSIHQNHNPPFFGGIGSTLTKYNEELYLFFGLSSNGYISNVCSLSIEEKVTESEAKKRKQKGTFEIQWHLQKDLDSESEF